MNINVYLILVEYMENYDSRQRTTVQRHYVITE